MIDDSINEASEQFGLELALPSYGAVLGSVSQATVIIDGPNDGKASHVSTLVVYLLFFLYLFIEYHLQKFVICSETKGSAI